MSINKLYNWEPYDWEEDFNSKTQWLSDKTKKEICSILNKTPSYLERDILIKDVLLKDLKENHVKVEENKEMFWYKWKFVYVSLPAIWNFKWFNFDFFVSDDYMYGYEFDKNPEFAKTSFSKKEISNFLKKFRAYMKERWIEFDRKVDFDTDLIHFTTHVSVTWCYQGNFTGLNWCYYLKNQERMLKTRTPRYGFSWTCDWSVAHLLFKIQN